MFGDGMRPGSRPGRGTPGSSDPNEAGLRLELRRDDARHAVASDPVDLHVLERYLDGAAQPLADATGVTGDLEGLQRDVVRAAQARVVAAVLPLHEERQLRVGLQAFDADLLPADLVAVRPEPVA